jgi:hypothetical protein
MAQLTTEADAFAARIFFNGQGVEVHEPYTNAEGITKHRRYTAWFNAPVQFNIGDVGTFTGRHSTKIDNWTNPDGTPKLDFEGKQGQSVTVQINDAVFTSAVAPRTAPSAPIDTTPF